MHVHLVPHKVRFPPRHGTPMPLQNPLFWQRLLAADAVWPRRVFESIVASAVQHSSQLTAAGALWDL
jgi:hypothetical protein